MAIYRLDDEHKVVTAVRHDGFKREWVGLVFEMRGGEPLPDTTTAPGILEGITRLEGYTSKAAAALAADGLAREMQFNHQHHGRLAQPA